MDILVVKDYQEMSEKAFEVIKKLISLKKDAVLGLATGSTPVGLYELMIKAYENGEVDYSEVVTYNLDEYIGLDLNHEKSYHSFMDEVLFDKINVKRENIHIPGSDLAPEKECERYNKLLMETKRDLQILGIGSNGHIAFNEPGTEFNTEMHIVDLTESTISDNARFFENIEDVPKKAITMGIQSIMDSQMIVLLASGENKADAVYKMIKGEITTDLPASVLQNHDNVLLIVDELAASKL